MNNDRFDDALRRKLEEVNPTFQEKNWTQLQRFMGSRGFPPSIWHSPTWLQPALTAAAAASVLVVSIWQYRTNQALTDRIQTLTNTVSRLEHVQSTLQQTVTDINSQTRTDTLYVVQRVVVPSAPASGLSPLEPGSSLAGTSAPNRPAPNPAVTGASIPGSSSERLVGRSQATMPQAANERVVASPDEQPLSSADSNVPDVAATTNSARTASQAHLPVSEGVVASGNTSRQTNRRGLSTQRTSTNSPGGRVSASSQASTDPALASSVQPQHETPVYTNPTAPNRAANSVNAGTSVTAQETTRPAAADLLTGVKPAERIVALSQSDDLTDEWQRRLRRVRYRSPFATTTPLASARPEQHTTPTNIRWRMGIGGELTTVETGVGVYGEVVINDRLTISAGLGQSNWSGVLYPNEAQFNDRIKRDFQKEYMSGNPDPGMINPGGPIQRPRQAFDISWSGSALVIPVQLGYRIDVGKRLFVSPFVGMNLSLNPSDAIDYSYEGFGPKPYQRINVVKERPVNLYSSWALGFGLERQFGPFVAQLSPMATVPMAHRDNSLNTASIGLRARLYYQF